MGAPSIHEVLGKVNVKEILVNVNQSPLPFNFVKIFHVHLSLR